MSDEIVVDSSEVGRIPYGVPTLWHRDAPEYPVIVSASGISFFVVRSADGIAKLSPPLKRDLEHIGRISLRMPPLASAVVAGALAGPLPGPGVVDVSSNLPVAFEPGDWIQLSAPTCFAVLRVRSVASRPLDEPPKVFLPYTTRTAIGQPRNGLVTVARLPETHAAPEPRRRRIAGSILRPALGSPRLTARVSEAIVGDDSVGVVRIDEGLFAILGIDGGDEVVLRSGDRSVRAIAVPPTDAMVDRMIDQRSGVTGQQSVADLFADDPACPEHLRVWVPATLRKALMMDRHGLVTIERSLPPLLRKRSAEMVLPLLGILLAAMTVDLPGSATAEWATIAFALVLTTVFSLAPLRVTREPTL